MSILETIIRELSEKFGLGGHAGALAMEALRAVTSERSGGLAGFISRFQTAGLGGLVSSWIGKGVNEPVTPTQLDTALGGDFISSIGSKLGLPAATVGPALAFVVPKLIDRLTPDGKVPSVLPAEVTSLLSGGAPRAAASATGTASTASRPAYAGATAAETRSGGGFLRKLIPLLGLLLLGLLAYWFFGRGGDEQTAQRPSVPSASAPSATTGPTTTATRPPEPEAAAPKAALTAKPSQLALQNADGRILYSGTVPDGQSQSRVIDALKSAFGASAVTGSVAVDPSAAPPTWLDKLAGVLGQFNIPGAEMLLKGDSINIGGAIPEDKKNSLIASLKSMLGDGFSVGTLTESLAGILAGSRAMAPAATASAVAPSAGAPSPTATAPDASASVAEGSAAAARAANEKAVAALEGLGAGYSAGDLVKVLNATVINFETGSAVIPASDEAFLQVVANGIKGAPAGSLFEIGGHTDSTGNAEANLALSQARSDAVRTALVNYGCDPAMLTAKGYGGTRPIASNDTVEGRNQNRRIEFTVIK
jgi:outer membrane protein OmpA-like peptidoglycan-associated protein/uncharacterized protein YidB (DUF937 family)